MPVRYKKVKITTKAELKRESRSSWVQADLGKIGELRGNLRCEDPCPAGPFSILNHPSQEQPRHPYSSVIFPGAFIDHGIGWL